MTMPETFDELLSLVYEVPTENLAGLRIRMSDQTWWKIAPIQSPAGHKVCVNEPRSLLGFSVVWDPHAEGLVLERACPGEGWVPTEETPQRCWWCGTALPPLTYVGVRRDRPTRPRATLSARHVRIPKHYIDARLSPRPTGIPTLRAAFDG